MITATDIIIMILSATIIGFFLGMAIFSQNNHDYEDDYEMNCTSSRHVFPPNQKNMDVYCFCGNEAMRYQTDNHVVIVKF